MRAERRIALVLGAGSSHHFGFPLGEELVTLIRRRAADILPRLAKGKEVAYGPDQLRERAQDFAKKLGPAKSIDVFLGLNPTFWDDGKKTIAGILLELEDERKLFDLGEIDKKLYDPWYKEFWDWLLRRDLRDFGSETLSIITFNYDRSLEHYLHSAARRMLEETEHDPTELLRKLRIVHVHGQLGPLQLRQYEVGVPYGGDQSKGTPTVPCILRAAEDIEIISEAEDDSTEFLEAREYLAEADTIILLGFGFHPDNLRRLFKDYRRPHSLTLAGTCLGYPRVKREALIETLLHHMGFPEAEYVTEFRGGHSLALYGRNPDHAAYALPARWAVRATSATPDGVGMRADVDPFTQPLIADGTDGVLRICPQRGDLSANEPGPRDDVVALDFHDSKIAEFMHNSPYFL
ncbi:SIR2 family protein [Planctomycetota bacterium]